MKRKHHELLAWQEAVGLVRLIYETTSKFPKDEVYALTSQVIKSL